MPEIKEVTISFLSLSNMLDSIRHEIDSLNEQIEAIKSNVDKPFVTYLSGTEKDLAVLSNKLDSIWVAKAKNEIEQGVVNIVSQGKKAKHLSP